MFTGLLERVGDLGAPVLNLLLFLLAYGESAFLLDLVVPGEVGLVFVSAALAEQDGSLVLAIILATIGAILGDITGYVLGRTVGMALVRKWEWIRKRLEPKVEKAQQYFERRGGIVVFLGRWVGALRAVVPLVAGTARMPFGRFLLWSVPAALSWCAAVVTLGFVVGRPAAEFLDRGGWIVSVLVLTALATWWLIRRHRKHKRDDNDERDSEQTTESATPTA